MESRRKLGRVGVARGVAVERPLDRDPVPPGYTLAWVRSQDEFDADSKRVSGNPPKVGDRFKVAAFDQTFAGATLWLTPAMVANCDEERKVRLRESFGYVASPMDADGCCAVCLIDFDGEFTQHAKFPAILISPLDVQTSASESSIRQYNGSNPTAYDLAMRGAYRDTLIDYLWPRPSDTSFPQAASTVTVDSGQMPSLSPEQMRDLVNSIDDLIANHPRDRFR